MKDQDHSPARARKNPLVLPLGVVCVLILSQLARSDRSRIKLPLRNDAREIILAVKFEQTLAIARLVEFSRQFEVVSLP